MSSSHSGVKTPSAPTPQTKTECCRHQVQNLNNYNMLSSKRSTQTARGLAERDQLCGLISRSNLKNVMKEFGVFPVEHSAACQ